MHDESTIRLIRTLFGLARRRATGILEVTCDARLARISFARGRLTYAEHRSLGATLGAYLVTRGLMSRAQYQALAEQVRVDSGRSPMLTFVERAIVAGALDVEQASAILAGQVERNVVELFAWDVVECRFREDAAAVEGGPRFPSELEALVLQGIRGRFDVDAVREHLGARIDMYPLVLARDADLVQTFRLQSAELRAARAMDGERTVNALFEESELDTRATAQVLLALKLAQQIQWSEARGGPLIRSDSSAAHAVPVAALQLTRREPLSAVRLTLPDPPSALEIEAASAFRQGVAAFREGRLEAARAQLAKATAQMRHPEHALYAAWVEHELAGRPRDPSAFQRLADAVRGALEHDATLAFAYYVVGQLHLVQQDLLNAQLAFRRAAKLDPTDPNAAAEVERLRAML